MTQHDQCRNDDGNAPDSSQGAALSREERYFQIFVQSLHVSARYRPRFGQKDVVSLDEFRALYGDDLFYHLIGLDSDLVYAAHAVAGGLTSLYRQIGIASERVFRVMVQETLELSPEETIWSYAAAKPAGGTKSLSLDVRIRFQDIREEHARTRLLEWSQRALTTLNISPDRSYQGCVFEVRQGYKSMDSKRQNADLDNGIYAHQQEYVPILLLLSEQINATLQRRYSQAHILFLTGMSAGADMTSTYVFCRDIIGYDLGAFFDMYSQKIRSEVEGILKQLLEAAE